MPLLFNTRNKVRGSTTIETGPGIFFSVLSVLSFYITRIAHTFHTNGI